MLKPRYSGITKVMMFVKWLIPSRNYSILITRSIRESALDYGYIWDITLLSFRGKEEFEPVRSLGILSRQWTELSFGLSFLFI